MSNRPRKCPSCGAQIQQGMRFCGKCGFDTQPQRPKPQSQQRAQGQKQKQPLEKQRDRQPPETEDKLPLTPLASEEPTLRIPSEEPPLSDQPAPLEEPLSALKDPLPPLDEPLPPERSAPTKKTDSSKPEKEPEPMLPRPVRAQTTRPRPIREQSSPRPASTARRPVDPAPNKEDRRNTMRMVTVIVVTVLIVAAAIILVVQLNNQEPSQPQAPSETIEPGQVHVIGADESTPTPEPTPDEAPATTPPQELIETPAPTEAVEPTEAPSPVTELNETVYVSGAGVNLRTGPSTTYAVAATLTRGTELRRIGVTDGWSQVEYNGSTYYISSSLISTEKPETAATPTPEPTAYAVTDASGTVVVVSAVNVRSGPGTGYSILEVAQPNTEMTRTGTVGNSWTRVSVNGKEGFVYSTYIRDKDAAATGSQTAPAGDPAGTVTIVSRANIRSGPGTGYGILGIAEVGESFDYYALSGSWYRISYKDQTAYVFNTLVSAKASS